MGWLYVSCAMQTLSAVLEDSSTYFQWSDNTFTCNLTCVMAMSETAVLPAPSTTSEHAHAHTHAHTQTHTALTMSVHVWGTKLNQIHVYFIQLNACTLCVLSLTPAGPLYSALETLPFSMTVDYRGEADVDCGMSCWASWTSSIEPTASLLHLVDDIVGSTHSISAMPPSTEGTSKLLPLMPTYAASPGYSPFSGIAATGVHVLALWLFLMHGNK